MDLARLCKLHMLLLLAVYSALLKPTLSYTVSDANGIHTAIFTGYNKLVLPASPVVVQTEYNLLTMNSLDLKSQTLSTSGWFTVVWNDSRLVWDSTSNGNIEYIYASQSLIWHPELIVENSIIDLTTIGQDDTQIRIRYDGEVRWEPAAILSTSCDMDVTFFPYDSQTCDIELASWGFHTDAVNLTFYKTDVSLQDYRKNGEWDLVSVTQHSTSLVEDGLTYSGLVFRIIVERLPGHYIMSVIFPVILTAILTVVTFILPIESGEKVGYILTVLLALAVLLTLFADNMPTTSKHTSVLVVFLTVTLGLASLAIILTILVIRLYHKPADYIPQNWMYTLARKCNKIKCEIKQGSVSSEDMQEEAEEIQHTEKKTWNDKNDLNHIKPFEKISNKALAEFFDNFLFVVFSVLYILVTVCFTITLSVAA